jgi:hypothetical protein
MYDPRWETFENFWEDMKASYTDTLTLERIDNSKGYSKENCRWATPHEQNMNMRSNVFIKYRDRFLTVSEVSKLTGIATSTIYGRKQSGWSDEKIISASPRTRNTHST